MKKNKKIIVFIVIVAIIAVLIVAVIIRNAIIENRTQQRIDAAYKYFDSGMHEAISDLQDATSPAFSE